MIFSNVCHVSAILAYNTLLNAAIASVGASLTFDFFGEEFDEDLGDDEEKIELDEDELISFLNEYYTINQDSLPKAEFY